MRVVHRGIDGDRVVDLDIDDPSRTVADLLAALGCPRSPAASAAVIDGRAVASHLPLSDVALCHGSVIEHLPRSTADASPTTTPASRMLAVSGGIRAGWAVAVDGPVRIGRDPGVALPVDDPGLCPVHLEVRVDRAVDLGSRNGTAVDGHPLVGVAPIAPGASIRAGTSRFSLRRPIADRPVAIDAALGARGGTIPFNRPPRRDPVTETPVPAVPGPAPEPPEREPLSLAGIVLPVFAGAVVAVLFSPFFAIFAALGPVLTVGTWWERRRRARREHRRATVAHERAVGEFGAMLPTLREAEIRRRRSLHPDPAEVVRRAVDLSVRLWERRPDHADAYVVGIGAADRPFAPDVPDAGSAAAALVAALPPMPDVPVPVELRPGRVVGLLGHRPAGRAVARSLVMQMAVHHGPADLTVAIGADSVAGWRWASWLPHTADPATGRPGAGLIHTGDARAAEAVLDGLGARSLLVVLDGDDPFQGRATVGRRLLADERTAVVVLVGDAHRLPAGCDTVVAVDELGGLRIVDPRGVGRGEEALGWGIPLDVAETAARRLARLDDPELPIAGVGIPATVSLLTLLGIAAGTPDEVERRWRASAGSGELVVPVGADADGPVALDLVADGPHVLVGGTTGSGKSEFLRALVAGAAATADPDHLAMVLVDYKGGAAFDCCAALPHVVGLVTDLDAMLAARALRCLEAELRHREERLRAAGAEDLRAWRAAADPDDDPLPRLLVVVDEFASLAADLPEFLDALVGIAQRGRSLGVHLVLATQRPAGAVTEDIRANTACRIALRMTDRTDSVDVIDVPDAAAIPRDLPGRCIARFGPEEVIGFQSALVTGRSTERPGISVRSRLRSVESRGPTDLERLVDLARRAHRRRGGEPPRSPWPPPLPDRISRVEVGATSRWADHQWMLVDDPDHQQQVADGWGPADGHLVVVGAPGSGLTTTLVTASLSVARGGAHHIHAIDLASGALSVLDRLAAVGTVVAPADADRRVRLVRWLDDELSRRRGAPAPTDPPVLVVIDDFGGLARAHDPVRDPAIHERLHRVWADGPAVGITMAVSLRRAADLPADLAATAATVLFHRCADPGDGLRFAVAQPLADLPAGRAVRAADGASLQVVVDGDDLAVAVESAAAAPPPPGDPFRAGILPSEIAVTHPDVGIELTPVRTTVTVAIADGDLRGHPLALHARQHVLVIGPARSGRTTTLAAIAHAAGDAAIVVGDGELARRTGSVPTTPAALDSALQGRGAALVLVDDATDVVDDGGALARLIDRAPVGFHVVAAVRPDRLRAAYGHWVSELRASRTGFLLRPDPVDGDLLGVSLPVRLTLAGLPGRGIAVCDAVTEVVQVVCPTPQSVA